MNTSPTIFLTYKNVIVYKMKTYILFDTWNGEGYSDSSASLVRTDDIEGLVRKRGIQYLNPGTENTDLKPMEGEAASFSYSVEDSSGRVFAKELGEETYAVLIEPDMNDGTLIDEEETRLWIETIKVESDDYPEESAFNTCHHLDHGAVIMITIADLKHEPIN